LSRETLKRLARPFILATFEKDPSAAGNPPEAAAEPEEFLPLVTAKQEIDPQDRVQHQAEDLLTQAQAELASAQGEAADIRHKASEEGYQKGYQQGLAEGVQASQARITAALDNLARAVEGLNAAKARVLAAMEGEVIALVQAVVDHVFLTKQAVDPNLVRQAAAEAVKRLAEAEKVTLRVNPGDMENIKEFRPELGKNMQQLKHMQILADPLLAPGDIVADTPTCQIDATLATRRARIFKLLEETLQQSHPLDLSPLADPKRKTGEDWTDTDGEKDGTGKTETW